MSESSQLYYLGNETNVSLHSQADTFGYVRDFVIPDVLKLNSNGEGDDKGLKIDEFLKVTKNNNIKKSIERIQNSLRDNDLVCLYSYGKHIQKLLSIVQLVSGLSKVELQQWNRLVSFVEVKEKRKSELVDEKIIIPIFIIVLTVKDNDLDVLYSLNFSKQG